MLHLFGWSLKTGSLFLPRAVLLVSASSIPNRYGSSHPGEPTSKRTDFEVDKQSSLFMFVFRKSPCADHVPPELWWPRRTVSEKKEREIKLLSSSHCLVFSSLHLCIIGYSHGVHGSSTGLMRLSLPRPKWKVDLDSSHNIQGRRTTWGSRSPVRAGAWLLSAWALRMRLDISGAKRTPLPQIPGELGVVRFVRRLCLVRNQVYPC